MNEELENGQQERVSPAAEAQNLSGGDILNLDNAGILSEKAPDTLNTALGAIDIGKKFESDAKEAACVSERRSKESENESRSEIARYESQFKATSHITKSGMKSEDMKAVLLNDSNNKVRIEKDAQEQKTARAQSNNERDIAIAREKEKTARFLGMDVIILGTIVVFGKIIVSLFKGKNPGNGSTLNFMTMNDLVKGVSVTPELEHHYVEVERAIGELEYLKKHCLEEEKTEAEELLKLLCGLHYALKALIFKDSHISPRTFQNRVRSLRKLLEEVGYGDNNPRLNKLLHDACNAEVSPQLRQQAREILEAINGKKS